MVVNVGGLFLFVLGSSLLHYAITGIWTGVLIQPRNRPPVIRAQDPIWFWMLISANLAVGSLLVLLIVAGWIKRGMASVPRRFTLREMFFAYTVAAVVLGLAVVAIKFAIATIHQPMFVFYFVFFATLGLMFLGHTWVEQMKGHLEPHAHNRNYVLRDYHPWRFWFSIAVRYLFGGAMLVYAIVSLYCAFLK